MRIAIVDDIKAEQEFLGRCLNRYCTEQLVPCEAATFDSGSAFIKNGIFDYDLIFLDIYMPGLNGLDTAARIRETNKDVLLIFTTTSADFAVKSYRVRAFDYLVKPLLLALQSGEVVTHPVEARLTRAVSSNHGREEFILVRLNGSEAEPVPSKSGLISTVSRANAYFVIPRDQEGLPKGALVHVTRL